MKRIISFWHFAAPWEKEKNPHSLISPWEINGWNAGGGKKPQIDPCCFNQGNVSAHICPCPFTSLLWYDVPVWRTPGTSLFLVLQHWLHSRLTINIAEKLHPAEGRFIRGCFFTVLFLGFCYDIWKKVLGCVTMATPDGAPLDCGSVSRSKPPCKQSMLTAC